ncbi:prolyl oligopeptidase family serine peptidase [Ornithinibacillus californiensis]|uniref:prolyl oligopeptidase family serine peptidase n=1 Tax=Ornithinibacillus californiensis TaxID=161536 RepID=UPI00064DB266|nr:prolyl oligopeptidase family serine peptidase [Ornithinibacillus californiensis]
MIGITKEIVGGVPSLVVVNTAKENNALPTVIYFHGITSAKEHNLPLAFLLAEKGMRVILPDSMYHGERESNDISDVRYYLFQIVLQNVKELQDMKVDLEEKGLLSEGRIGVAGTSMGGITTAAALTQYSWIKSAAILMGSPKLTSFARELVDVYRTAGDLPLTVEEINQLYDTLTSYDLSLQAEKLNDRPLLFWHGDSDSTVPFDHSYRFYLHAKKLYKDQANLAFLRESGRDHKVSRYAILETMKWFVKHL